MEQRQIRKPGGWGEIRTHSGVAATPVFKTGALNRSTTHPPPEYQSPAAECAEPADCGLGRIERVRLRPPVCRRLHRVAELGLSPPATALLSAMLRYVVPLGIAAVGIGPLLD